MLDQANRLTITIIAHGVLRIAGSASGVLIGIYLANLHSGGSAIGVGIVGILGAISFVAELIFSIPFGMISDAASPRWLMVPGAILGAFAVQLFPLSAHVSVFLISRFLEGISMAAVTPPLLAYLAGETVDHPALRARAMSFFELSLLAGLALGGLVGSGFWQQFHMHAFSMVATAYLACAALLWVASKNTSMQPHESALRGLGLVLRDSSVRSLAPVWLCVNAIVGLWLGPTLPFLLTRKAQGRQYLDGVFAAHPMQVGWLLLGYSVVFGMGVTGWSFVLPHIQVRTAMRIALVAMLPVCLGLFVINHSGGMSSGARWSITAITALLVMIESGFTPAALAWLAQSLGAGAGKGAAMGIYSVLLSLGAIGGSLLAAGLGHLLQMDGLLLGTAFMGACGLVLLHLLRTPSVQPQETNYEHA